MISLKNSIDEHFKPKDDSISCCTKKMQQSSRNWHNNIFNNRGKPSLQEQQKYTFTVNHMAACGLEYTADGDTAICNTCGFTFSHWTADLNPFLIHAEQKPECEYVRSIKSSLTKTLSSSNPSSLTTTTVRNTSTVNEHENPTKRIKIEATDPRCQLNTLLEVELLQQIRKRTFSHWPHRTIPSSAQMIEAGFFNCNVGDRVICIYCNIICQQWTPHTDDPCEVHKTLSPNCIYVRSKLLRPPATSIVILNETSSRVTAESASTASSNLEQLRSHEIVYTAACNAAYIEIPKRHASFATWPTENVPSADDLVRAGFFYTGTKTIVTCFYCNGSLQNWGSNDNPMIEHSRWFPHCAYAKQLCGDDLYRKIQESKRAQQERARANELKEKGTSGSTINANQTTSSRLLVIPDESTLSRLVAARLDLPISQRLLDQKFKLSIIKRCWEDQLRLKLNDFVTECDLSIACLILQKQIEHIDGKKENIIIPSIRMKQIREGNEAATRETILQKSRSATHNTDVEMNTASSESSTNQSSSSSSSEPSNDSSSKPTANENQSDTKTLKPIVSNSKIEDQSNDTNVSNPCVLCLAEEKRLACIPCGHLATCVPCGHSLRSCPICRREIDAFVRVYI